MRQTQPEWRERIVEEIREDAEKQGYAIIDEAAREAAKAAYPAAGPATDFDPSLIPDLADYPLPQNERPEVVTESENAAPASNSPEGTVAADPNSSDTASDESSDGGDILYEFNVHRNDDGTYSS